MAYATGLSICLALLRQQSSQTRKPAIGPVKNCSICFILLNTENKEPQSNKSWSYDRNTHRSGIPEGARYKPARGVQEEETDSVLMRALQQRRLFLLWCGANKLTCPILLCIETRPSH